MTEQKITVFSKYFGYEVGGAEKSVFELLKTQAEAGAAIEVIVAENVRSFGAGSRPASFPVTWRKVPLRLRADLERWRYVDYAANRSSIERYFAKLDPAATLYTYGLLAPAAIRGFRGRTVYLVRDEYGLGWDRNYYSGLRWGVRELYTAAQWPLRRMWLRDLMFAIRKSRLIANSEFIRRELGKLSPTAEIELIRSHVDCVQLRAALKGKVDDIHTTGRIVAVGASRIKGGDVVYRVAKSMPEYSFLIFDKSFSEERQNGNVREMPWNSNAAAVYEKASVLMVPSRWEEAFPRVVLEARCLGIPVVASRRGGIPEAVGDSDALIEDLEDVSAWRAALMARIDVQSHR